MRMKRFLVTFLIVSCCSYGYCATARRATNSASATPTASRATNARAAVNARSAKPVAQSAQNTQTKTVGVRSAARSAVPEKSTTVSARAATTQKVIATGTKVATAAKNTVVSDVCSEKYNGCMDAFCMTENESGGRCVCSNVKDSFDSILKDIEELDLRSYELATAGVESLEMGENADEIMGLASGAIARVDAGKKRSLVDLSMWKTEEKTSIATGMSVLDGKAGDDLYVAVHNICEERMPECANDMPILKMIYKKQIESDCAAYENSLKDKKLKAQQNLDTAQRALRETAKEQFESANKYDLGQCTIKFKECMQTTAGCGNDFSGCAETVATDNTNVSKSTKSIKRFVIKGAMSGVDISASTYDTLVAKKVMCESVTKNCTRVADQVFDAFLREVAPTLRNAELVAEDKIRQNCIESISDCFQNACKDNMDPNDPDGSYDMCLSRPETMLNVCKIPLQACGINATQESTALESPIWEFVVARLSAMRVDACTVQIKECLQDKGRCGKDYTQCMGLDIDSVVAMCPIDKLVACDSSEYLGDGAKKLAYVYNVAQGLLLNIDNTFLEQCQNAVQTKMLEICGDTVNCFTDRNEYIGTNSLRTQHLKNGDYLIDGLILFGNINMKHPTDADNDTGRYVVTYDMEAKDNSAAASVYDRIRHTVVADIQNELNRKMSILMSDPTVDMCINGRDMSQIKRGAGRDSERFPNLLVPYAATMFDSLVTMAKQNYNVKYANEYSTANSLSEQYKNTLFCNAMIDIDTGNSEMMQQGSGVKEFTDYSVLIAGTFDQNLLDAIEAGAQNEKVISVAETVGTEGVTGNDKYAQVNKAVTRQSEIAREISSAVYEPGPKVCRITKTIYACTGYQAAYNEHSESYSVSVGTEFYFLGTGGGVDTSVSESESSKTYQGKTCSTYAEPLITEQLINFADENVLAGQITRSNLTSMTIDASSTTTSTSSGWSLGLSMSYSDNDTQNVTNNADTINNNYNGSVDTVNNMSAGK